MTLSALLLAYPSSGTVQPSRGITHADSTDGVGCPQRFGGTATDLGYCHTAGKWAECIADGMTAIKLDCSYVKG